MARENRESAFAVNEFARVWQSEALDVDYRQQCLHELLQLVVHLG